MKRTFSVEARLHADRAARGDRDHRHPGRDPLPRLRPGPREGARRPPASPTCRQIGTAIDDVRAGLRRDVLLAEGLGRGSKRGRRAVGEFVLHLRPLAGRAPPVLQKLRGIPVPQRQGPEPRLPGYQPHVAGQRGRGRGSLPLQPWDRPDAVDLHEWAGAAGGHSTTSGQDLRGGSAGAVRLLRELERRGLHRAANWNGGENGWNCADAQQRRRGQGAGDHRPADGRLPATRYGNEVVFCDGHVKWTRWNNVADAKAPATSAEQQKWWDMVDPNRP